MTSYEIINSISGVHLGVYEGETETEVLDALARSAGYADYTALCEVAPEVPGELSIKIKRPNHPNRSSKLPVTEARKSAQALMGWLRDPDQAFSLEVAECYLPQGWSLRSDASTDDFIPVSMFYLTETFRRLAVRTHPSADNAG